MTGNPVFDEIADLLTEQRNPLTVAIDRIPTTEILELINREDQGVPAAVARIIPEITRAVGMIVDAFMRGGRLLYVGAGTSGRLGVLDAAECLPTFGIPQGMVKGIIAGGPEALVGPVEGAEDHVEDGVVAMRGEGVSERDVVVGITASRRTPYVVGALTEAKRLGAMTVLIACNPSSKVEIGVDVLLCPVVGPEVIAGSTRMKAGTAQKLILNMLTTASMIRIGKVYSNLMVDLQPTSQKLIERSKRIVMMCGGLSYQQAQVILEETGGDVKRALVMALSGVTAEEAEKRLVEVGGFVGEAIKLSTFPHSGSADVSTSLV
ncbi:MAG: N-acetylmuramic acid 6-phosphate etherase [Candidatus Latescibacteria bacterium]|nr:N-acetylmuramic acid 6-phosphate etherase [Candidatus Latescibacterota bacterium]